MLAFKEKNILTETIQIQAPTPNLSLSIRNLLLHEISRDILEETPIIKELAQRIRKNIDIYPVSKVEAYQDVVGVDAGSQIIPLASRQYAVIGALAYNMKNRKRFFLPPESFASPYSRSESFTGIVNLRREAKLYETAYKYLEENPDLELMLIDGPLAFSNWWKSYGKEEDRQRLINAVNRLLKRCQQMDVVVAGVVKRPSARYLVHYLGIQKETDLPDSFLMLQTLSCGERTDIFSPRTALRMAARVSPMMDVIEAPIYSFYIRTTKEWSIPPIRIDLPAFCLGYLDEIANYCYATSFYNGIPLPIVKADEEVKVSRRFIGDVYREILSRISRENGEFSQLAPYWGEGGWLGV